MLATAIAMTMLGAFLAIAAFVQIGAGVFWSFLVSLFVVSFIVTYRRPFR